MATVDIIRDREKLGCKQRCGEAIVNVGEAERLASKVGGGVLVAIGAMRGGVRGLTLAGLGAALLYRGMTGHCPLYHVLGANTADHRGPSDSVPAQAGVRIEESITIDRSPEELYRFWRDYSNLPQFMEDIESVTSTSPDGTLSHWVAKGPLGTRLEWDAVIHNEIPGRLIAWRSTGGQVETAGSVRFVPCNRGTEVHLNQKFNPPGGKLGVAVATLLGHDPAVIARHNLRRLKQLQEAGAIPAAAGPPPAQA